jgi:hypothetical protein
MLVEASETFLKKDKVLVGRSLVQAIKNVFVRVMNPSADTRIIYPGTILAQVSPVIRKQPSFPAYLRLTRLPSTSNILFCKSIKPAFDLKQSKHIFPSTVICTTNACTTISFVRVSLKYAGKLGCFRIVAHDKVVMPAQSEMIIR